jgi:BioD-like phosphotransacetylase family protein
VTAADGVRRLFGRLRINDAAKIRIIASMINERVDVSRLIADLRT